MKKLFSKVSFFFFFLSILTSSLFSQDFIENTGIHLPGIYGGSAEWGDYDNDGNLDILLSGSANWDYISRVYHNNGDDTFTYMNGIDLPGLLYSTATWGDSDNDGDLDILISGISDSGLITKLFRNNGNNTFSEITENELPGIYIGSIEWGDYDNDGDLDIFLVGGSKSGPISKIFRNDGDNNFTEQLSISLEAVRGATGSWADYDNDGDLDIILAVSISETLYKSIIYRNNAPDSTGFTEQSDIDLPGIIWGRYVWGDYDSDGNLDILITGLTPQGAISTIYRNNGNNSFTEQTDINLIGLSDCTAAWGDYDNDGDLDIFLKGYAGSDYISNIYRNNGDNSFTLQSEIDLVKVGLGSVAWGDYDNDGDLDILLTGDSETGLVSRIYKNESIVYNNKPSAPSNLETHVSNNAVTFMWDKSLDTETPQNALNYNMYIYETGQSSFELSPNAFKQTDILNGRRIIARMGAIQWSEEGYTIYNLLPGKTYYWAVQAVDGGLQGGEFCTEQSFTIPLYRPVSQAGNIEFTELESGQLTATWANGSGNKRAVFIKETTSGTADPIDNITYNLNDITPDGWKCIYNSTGNSTLISDLILGHNYVIQVCEYNGESGSEMYLKSVAHQNPAFPNTIFIDQKDILLTNVELSSSAWGDYDNDGDLDILLSGESAAGYTTQIYCNNGDNSFTENTNTIFPQIYRGSVAWGDYDNDGDLDILLTGGDYETAIYANNGDGSFAEQTDIPLEGLSNSSAAWGDYDNDGDLDIIMTGNANSGYISKIYRNNGSNIFTEQTGISLTGTGGLHTNSLEWKDFDRDGDLDILIAGQTSESDRLTIIYSNNGDNSFTEQSNLTLTGVLRCCVASGDYNNDGYLDILLTGQNSLEQPVSKLYLNNTNNSFSEQTEIKLADVINSSVAWGDYDNDGDLDILLAGDAFTNWITKIYQNNGDNSFSEIYNLRGVIDGSTSWGDYDSDGDLDILLTGRVDQNGNKISKIYRNESLNPNIAPSVPTALQAFWKDDCLNFTWNKSSDNNTPTTAIIYNLRIGTSPGGNDIKSAQTLANGDLLLPNIQNPITDTCIKLKLPLKEYYWTVQSIDKGGLTSTFAAEEIVAADSLQANSLTASIKSSNSMLIRWNNGNGLRRVVFCRISSAAGSAIPVNGTNYHAEPYFGEGDQIEFTNWYCVYNGQADSTIIFGISEGYSYDVQVFEFVNKDLPEYFSSIGIGNPGIFSTSRFSEQTAINFIVHSFGKIASWGDFNNDGYLDILTPQTIYINNGNNSFTELAGINLTGFVIRSLEWGDYDNDGDLDALIAVNSDDEFEIPSTKIFRNNSDNSFTEQTGISLTGGNQTSMDIGDYDNNGYLDILISSLGAGQPETKIYRNNGDNSFSEYEGLPIQGVYEGSVSWGDYDNDGNLDFLLTGTIDGNYVGATSKIYRNTGNNNFEEQIDIDLSGVYRGSTAWGDYDNDGDLDIVLTGLSNLGQHITKIYNNSGNNSFIEQEGIVLTGVYNSTVLWSDYDNDGYLDIIMIGSASSSSNYISKIYRNNGDNSFTEQSDIQLTGISSGNCAMGDYDNDGDLDFLMAGESVGSIITSKIYRNNTFMKAGDYEANRKPIAPINLISKNRSDGVIFYWSPVKTDETSFETMSYNVSIRSTQGGSDVYSALSDSINGFRRLVKMGNAQLDTTLLVKNIPSGKYYWKVQAVDQGYLGGDWSGVDSFEVRSVQSFYSADTVCQGLSTHFTDQSVSVDEITSWSWDFGDGFTSSEQHPTYIFASSGTHHVKLLVRSVEFSDSITQEVIVLPKPEVNFTSDIVCQGSSTSFINSSNLNSLDITLWKWDFGDGSISSEQNPGSYGYLNPGDYNVKLIALADNTCSDSTTRVTSVGAIPVAAITSSGNPVFCNGDSIVLSVNYNENYLYQWKNGGAYLTGTDTSQYIAKTSGNYTIEIENPIGNCVAVSDALSVTARPIPVAPAINNSGSDTFCSGDSVILSVTYDPDISYQWRLNSGAIGTDTCLYVSRLSGTYTLELSNSTGCSSISTNTIEVLVHDLPPVPAVALEGSLNFCEDTSLILSIIEPGAYDYQWMKDASPLINQTETSLKITQSGSYYLKVSNSNASQCSVSTATYDVNVSAYPNPPVIETENYTIDGCQEDDPIVLSIAATENNITYKWYMNNKFIPNATYYEYEGYLPEGEYKVIADNNGCSVESDSVVIRYAEMPDKPEILAVGPTVWYLVCSDTTASAYKWYYNGKLIPGADENIYVANQELGKYEVSVSEGTCFTKSDPVWIPLGTGIDLDPWAGLKIYPNPTPGLFTLEMDNPVMGALMIDILNERGSQILNIKFLKETSHFETQIDLSGQPSAVYLISLMLQDWSTTRSVVVE